MAHHHDRLASGNVGAVALDPKDRKPGPEGLPWGAMHPKAPSSRIPSGSRSVDFDPTGTTAPEAPAGAWRRLRGLASALWLAASIDCTRRTSEQSAGALGQRRRERTAHAHAHEARHPLGVRQLWARVTPLVTDGSLRGPGRQPRPGSRTLRTRLRGCPGLPSLASTAYTMLMSCQRGRVHRAFCGVSFTLMQGSAIT
jgi:hypothetical protein